MATIYVATVLRVRNINQIIVFLANQGFVHKACSDLIIGLYEC